jgi:hypothetical protein
MVRSFCCSNDSAKNDSSDVGWDSSDGCSFGAEPRRDTPPLLGLLEPAFTFDEAPDLRIPDFFGLPPIFFTPTLWVVDALIDAIFPVYWFNDTNMDGGELWTTVCAATK